MLAFDISQDQLKGIAGVCGGYNDKQSQSMRIQ